MMPPIQLRVIESPTGSKWDTEVGDMWRAPSRDDPDREAWCVHLPGNAGFWYTTERASGTDQRWEVNGTPPAITVTPSIDCTPYWHGSITNGAFS